MAQCLVIADDLTGANATGVLLRENGFSAKTLLNLQRADKESLDDCDVIVYPTTSRAIPSGEAYRRVYEAASKLRSGTIRLYGKRIDSTLRGNLGSEIDAILDGIGDNRIAVVVPAFPNAGRIVVGGYLLVNGVALQKTDAAKDPKMPVDSSCVETLVRQQTKYPVRTIMLDILYRGKAAVSEEILRGVSEGARIFLFDAADQSDLNCIADAAVDADVPFVSVDPGPFTETAALRLLERRKRISTKKLLLSVGSITPLTERQLEEVFEEFSGRRTEMHVERLAEGGRQAQEEIARVAGEVLRHGETDVNCISVNSLHAGDRLDFGAVARRQDVSEEEISQRVNRGIAEITCRILKADGGYAGVLTSGGDITFAVCEKLHASGLVLYREIIPLAAYGVLSDGEVPGLRLISKGGLVGDKRGLAICVEFFKELMSQGGNVALSNP